MKTKLGVFHYIPLFKKPARCLLILLFSICLLGCKEKPGYDEGSGQSVPNFHVIEFDPVVPLWDDGVIRVSPDRDVVVGSMGTWTVRFSTRSREIGPGGSLLFIVTPFWGWSPPQTFDPTRQGYTTVSCSAKDPLAQVTTPAESIVQVVFGRYGFKPGDTLIITFGDTSGGQFPAARARTDRYAETAPAFFIKVDPDKSGVYRLVRESPPVTTISLPEVRIVGTCPTEVLEGEPFRIRFAAVDRFGNFNQRATATFHIVDPLEKIDRTLSMTEVDAGVLDLILQFSKLGWHHLFISDETSGQKTELNPVLCLAEAPVERLFWGDIHGHSSLSDGTGSVHDYFSYARDIASLDFCALTDHDFHGFKPLSGENWVIVKQAVKKYHKDGSFVVFLGYEWTSWDYGHRNVYYPGNTGEVFSHRIASSDSLPELWDLIAPYGACTIPHHVAGGPIPADWSFHNPQREWLVEISSVHGTSEMLNGPSMIYNPKKGHFAVDALLKGYNLGFMASSDSHDGHPGAHPRTGEIRGLIALRAPKLTRAALWQRFRQRAVYGTSGVRIYLDFSVNHVTMGQELVLRTMTEKRTIQAHAVGQQFMEKMVLIKDGQIIHRTSGNGYEVRLDYDETTDLAGRHFYYVRAQQMDGQLAWSSPVWVTGPPDSTANPK